MVRFGCIVEGHGEMSAVPELIRRIAADIDPSCLVEVIRPVRTGRQRLVQAGELERAVALLAAKLDGKGCIFVLVDADEDCPAELGPQLKARVECARSDMPCAVVVAKVEYEAWFLAAASSLRGKRGLTDNIDVPGDPEGVRDAKGWLSERMTAGTTYKETLDQVALTALFDLSAARAAPSFDKCYRDIERLLLEAGTQPVDTTT